MESQKTERRRGSLQVRLVIGFVLVLGLLLGLAGVAVNRVSAISASLATINDTNSVKQRFAINFRGSVHDRAISLRDVVLVAVPAERAAALADIERLAADYAASATRLDALMATGAEVTPREREILASIKATESRTMPLVRQVIEAQQRGVAGQAQALLLEQARPGFVEWLARINQFIDLEEEKNRLIGLEARGVAAGFQTLMLVLVAAGLVLGTGIAAWAMGAMKPLRQLSAVMLKMAAGESVGDIPGQGRRDEVGVMAEAVAVFRSQGEEARRLRETQEADRTAAHQRQVDALRGMADRVENETLEAMARISGQARGLAGDTDAMAAAAARVGENTKAVGEAAEASLGIAETVAAAAEELTASIRGITHQVQEAAEVSRAAASDSAETETAIVALSGAVGQIGAVTRLIQEIAGKTNLLALNATIESARAGDAGKGFAVVAGEVKALAAQTAQATQEIGRHIEAVSQRTDAAVETVRRIAGSVSRLDQLAATLAETVGQQDDATREIARSIAESTHASRAVTERLMQVSVDARDAGERALRTQSATADLAVSAEDLRHQVVEIVRTSVPEVNRRQAARRPGQGEAELTIGGERQKLAVADVSEGGVGLVGSVNARPGERGTVALPGKPAVGAEVRSVQGGRVGVAFVAAGGVAAGGVAASKVA